MTKHASTHPSLPCIELPRSPALCRSPAAEDQRLVQPSQARETAWCSQ